MPRIWQLNAILLHHSQRFFHAAYQAIDSCAAAQNGKISTTIALLGNLLWAKSPFLDLDKATNQEHDMALTGALLGTLSDALVPAEMSNQQALTAGLAQLERQFLSQTDALLQTLLDDLEQHAPKELTPAQLNRYVWERLFPAYPYEESLPQLQARIAQRLQNNV